MSSAYERITRNIASRSVGMLTERLRDMATSAGWPVQVVKAISVRQTKSDIEIHVASGYETQVNEWEYGTTERAPTGVIRNFTARVPKLIEQIVVSEMRSGIDEIVGSL